MIGCCHEFSFGSRYSPSISQSVSAVLQMLEVLEVLEITEVGLHLNKAIG